MPSSPQTDTSLNHNHRCRIVLTGGPGGGKTTAADLFRREIGEGVVIVPEAATMMFSGGFPRHQQQDSLQAVQRAIYHVQRNLEDIQATQYPERILLCDRGTIDGAAYWPGDSNLFFEEQDSSLEQELSRYDGVIFFESAAVGGLDIEGGNPARLTSPFNKRPSSTKNSSNCGLSTRTSSRCITTRASFRKSPSASLCSRRWSPT